MSHYNLNKPLNNIKFKKMFLLINIYYLTFLLSSVSIGQSVIQEHCASPSSVNLHTRPAPQCFFSQGPNDYQKDI